MNFFSIKWKISISFVLFTLSFLGIYVVLATRVFQSDKLSYVFESQQRQVDAVAQDFAKVVDRAVLGARAIALGVDLRTRRIQPSAERFFYDEKSIEALDLRAPSADKPLFWLEKSRGLLGELGDFGAVKNDKANTFHLNHWRDDLFVITLTDYNEDQEAVQTRIVLRVHGLLDDALEGQTLAVVQKARVAMLSEPAEIEVSDVERFLYDSQNELPDGTAVHTVANRRQLISAAATAVSGFSVLGILPEQRAMSALQSLYRRSLVFILFSAFATIFVSLLLSFGLTRSINTLTLAAQRLGRGDFSGIPESPSRDEVGILSKAFQRMIFEIQRLLRDTADKTRMEAELKTARLVQESLLPEAADARVKTLSLSGFYATSSECGGDWWYYYVRGDELFVAVADATGHGTPAALVTSAARSLFSFVERSDLSLKEIMSHWNEAVAVCSKQKVFMTALLVRINVLSGMGSYINAGHEPPVLLEKEGDGYRADFLIGVQSATLGERGQQQWSESQFEIKSGGRLVLFTDGLTAFQSPEGKTIGDRRFLRVLERISGEKINIRSFVDSVFEHFNSFGGHRALPDDVCFVCVEKMPPTESA